MSPYRKNILVGVTVLGSIVVLGWMVVEFSGKVVGAFSKPQMAIQFQSTRADGLSDGSNVYYLGVPAGRVTSVRRKDDGSGVLIDALIDRTPSLPANILAKISSSNALGGTAALNIEVADGETAHGQLEPREQPIPAKYVGLQLNFLSPEITASAKQIGDMSEEIRKSMQQLRESNTIKDLDTTILQVRETISKAGQVMDALSKTVGDPKIVDEVRDAVNNIHTAAESAAKVASKMDGLADKLAKNSDDVSETLKDARGHIDDLSKAVGDRLTQISKVLSNVDDITAKMNKGDGTAGMLMNDPRLYKELVDSSRELSATITDLHRLIDQWEQEGVSLKVGK